MTKRHLIIFLLAVLAIASASASTWKMHSYYVTASINNVFDTGDKIYYLNSNRLFKFDKATKETVAMTKQNLLSDGQIKQIYYDYESELLFIAYANSNIDVIDRNGTVRNVSGLKDVVVRVHMNTLSSGILSDYVGKEINDINFANGMAYVALGFGYVVIDESDMSIKASYDFGNNISVNSVCLKGNQLLILTNVNCYYGDPAASDPIHTFSKKSVSAKLGRLTVIDDNTVFMLSDEKLSYIDFSTSDPTVKSLVSAAPTCVQRTPTGFIANFSGQKYYYTIDPTGKTATKVELSAVGFATSFPGGDGTVWMNDANGLYIKGTTEYYKINSLTTEKPYWLKYNAESGLLFVGTSAKNGGHGIGTNESMNNVVNTYDGVSWQKATPYSTGTNYAGYEFVFSPTLSNTYVRATWTKGIYKVTDGTQVTNYTSTNSMVGTYKAHPAFDNYGNMWVVSPYGNNDCPVAVLPRAKFEKTSVSKSDWFQPAGFERLATGSMQRSRFLVSKKNNVKIFCDGEYPNKSKCNGAIVCWDNGNQDPKVGDYQQADHYQFVDQNDKIVDWTYIIHMEEDNEGLVWVGHTMGVFVFDPEGVFDEQPRAVRPFVTKFNEGAGYLCEGYTVYDIGVDADNNKWLATDNGLYFVSPDASEVYFHFTVDNSDLPSDIIYSVECDTVAGCVYIYTADGFAEYVQHGDAAALDFQSVYAFPDPVEPDFTGLIKIAGLMENTYITITDREGNTVAQLGPVMGSALWDACNESGERLPTGRYNIHVAQGAYPVVTDTDVPATTVMIIR